MPNPSFEVDADLFLPLIQSAYQGVADFVMEKNKEHDFFGKATRKYVTGLFERNSTIKVLTMRGP